MYVIYGKQNCSYCVLAKQLLDEHHLKFDYIGVDQDEDNRQWLLDQGFQTVPQIWHGNKYIGGYVELEAYLDQ